MPAKRYVIPPMEPGQRLDLVLTGLNPALSRSQVQRLVRDGHVEVIGRDGRRVAKLKTGLLLTGGETVVVEKPDREPLTAAPEDIPLDIRYEDDDVLVVNKPAGLVVHPAPGHGRGTLVNALAAYAEKLSSVGGSVRPGIVHRLDKDTSGLLLVAKDNRAHAALARQLTERVLSREYLALVWGHPIPPAGRIDAPVGRAVRGGKAMQVGGRACRTAITHYETLEPYPYTSWLRINLETGRTHQIRVHLRHAGHPVVGDPQYGGREKALSGIAPSYRRQARALLDGLDRQALHAWRIRFRQPSTGILVTVSADPPGDIVRARERAQGRE